jgi:hypothetical protein
VKSHNRQIQFQANEQTTTRRHINAEKNVKLAILQQGSKFQHHHKNHIMQMSDVQQQSWKQNDHMSRRTTCGERERERERERESHDIIQQNFS